MFGIHPRVAFCFRALSCVMFFLSMYCTTSVEAAAQVRHIAENVLNINNLSDWAIQTFFIWIAYTCSYLGLSSVFEYTNPAPKDEARKQEIKDELALGLFALFYVVIYATLWLWLVEPHTPYYGYYVNHPMGISSFFIQMGVYMLFFDTWFYWTHRLLHTRFFWRNVHYVHHRFLHPTAFCQDAVHPIEGLIQGPMGHHLAACIFPIHPICQSLFGFMTSVYAIAAHDGRAGDLNNHTKHHTHKHVNFGLYWGLWDYICGTRYIEKKSAKWERVVDDLNEDADSYNKSQ